MISKLSLTFIFVYCSITQNSFGLSPVILIPGDGGSQLEAKLNRSSVVHYICAKTSKEYFNVWLNLELLVPFVIDCFVDNTRLEYNNVTRKTNSPAGVDIRVPGWGTTEPVEWLDPSHDKSGSYFNSIADALVKVGYVRNVSIRGAPYDFRKAPNENKEFFVKLKSLVEETYTMNNKSSVSLVVHSMGGSMALQFLRLQSQSWKDQYIRRLISLSTPWGGSIKALKVFAIGDDLGSLMLRESIMRTQQISCPSLAWLLPSPLFWKPGEVLVQTDKVNYTIADLQQLFNDMELPTAWEMRKDTAQFAADFSAPGVELHCLYGHNISTVERLVYKPGTWLDGYPTLVSGDGDGTVNLRSLSACNLWAGEHDSWPSKHDSWPDKRHKSLPEKYLKNWPEKHHKSWSEKYPKWPVFRKKWRSLNRGKSVKAVPLPNAEHLRILHDPRAMQYIVELLHNTTAH